MSSRSSSMMMPEPDPYEFKATPPATPPVSIPSLKRKQTTPLAPATLSKRTAPLTPATSSQRTAAAATDPKQQQQLQPARTRSLLTNAAAASATSLSAPATRPAAARPKQSPTAASTTVSAAATACAYGVPRRYIDDTKPAEMTRQSSFDHLGVVVRAMQVDEALPKHDSAANTIIARPSPLVHAIQQAEQAQMGNPPMRSCNMLGMSRKVHSMLPKQWAGPKHTATVEVPPQFVTRQCAIGLLQQCTAAPPALAQLVARGKEMKEAEFQTAFQQAYQGIVLSANHTPLLLAFMRLLNLVDNNEEARQAFVESFNNEPSQRSKKRHIPVQLVLLLAYSLRSAPQLMKAYLQHQPPAWLWQFLLEATSKDESKTKTKGEPTHLSWLLHVDKDTGTQLRLHTILAVLIHDAQRRRRLNLPAIGARSALRAMNYYRWLDKQAQELIDSFWLPDREYDVPDEVLDITTRMLFGRTSPERYFHTMQRTEAGQHVDGESEDESVEQGDKVNEEVDTDEEEEDEEEDEEEEEQRKSKKKKKSGRSAGGGGKSAAVIAKEQHRNQLAADRRNLKWTMEASSSDDDGDEDYSDDEKRMPSSPTATAQSKRSSAFGGQRRTRDGGGGSSRSGDLHSGGGGGGGGAQPAVDGAADGGDDDVVALTRDEYLQLVSQRDLLDGSTALNEVLFKKLVSGEAMTSAERREWERTIVTLKECSAQIESISSTRTV